MLYQSIKKYYPGFKMIYEIDPLKQSIADSWPNRLDDSCAREEWDWQPHYDLGKTTEDMIKQLRMKNE
jgi:nucleoside-diphosphate-sugar epimerase